LELLDYSHKILETGDLYSFDCGDKDLNEFFLKDAIPHKKELIGVTYFFYAEKDKSAIAFFTVSNDAVRTDTFKDELPHGKQYSFYPAVKIGRFGVDKKYQHSGVGTQLMDFIRQLFTYENKTGCRFLTVDAYNKPETLSFYLKSGFVFHTDKDKNRHIRTMRYDLKPYSDKLHQKLQIAGHSTYSNR
jgi:GNAT superfamily N-acetyltransferase